MSIQDKVEGFIATVRNSFVGAKEVYTTGSCYQFYRILKLVFPQAEAYYDSDHVITEIDGLFYDITGLVKCGRHLRMSIHYPVNGVTDCQFNIFGVGVECPYLPVEEENPEMFECVVSYCEDFKAFPVKKFPNMVVLTKEDFKKVIIDAYWGGLNGYINAYEENGEVKESQGAEKYYNETFKK